MREANLKLADNPEKKVTRKGLRPKIWAKKCSFCEKPCWSKPPSIWLFSFLQGCPSPLFRYICVNILFHFLSNHFGRCHIFTFPGSALCSFQKISSRKRNCWSALTTRKLVANKKWQKSVTQKTKNSSIFHLDIHISPLFLENIISEKCLFLLGRAAWLPQERSPQQQEQLVRLEILNIDIKKAKTNTRHTRRKRQTQTLRLECSPQQQKQLVRLEILI